MHARMEYTLCKFVSNTISWGAASTEELKTDRAGLAKEMGREEPHVVKKKLIPVLCLGYNNPSSTSWDLPWEKKQLCTWCPEFPAVSKSSTDQQSTFTTTKPNVILSCVSKSVASRWEKWFVYLPLVSPCELLLEVSRLGLPSAKKTLTNWRAQGKATVQIRWCDTHRGIETAGVVLLWRRQG